MQHQSFKNSCLFILYLGTEILQAQTFCHYKTLMGIFDAKHFPPPSEYKTMHTFLLHEE